MSNGLCGRVTFPHGSGVNLAVHPDNRNAFSSLYQLIPLDAATDCNWPTQDRNRYACALNDSGALSTRSV